MGGRGTGNRDRPGWRRGRGNWCRRQDPGSGVGSATVSNLKALWARNSGLLNAKILIAEGKEGGNITVGCIFNFSGKWKIFCKGKCIEGKVLIVTHEVTAQSGRYSIAYKEGTFPVSPTVLNVSITKLRKSDAGKYKCGLQRTFTLYPSNQEIEIRVEDAPISSKAASTLQPFSASVPSASTLTTQSLSSGPGGSTPSSASPQAPLVYVGLCLAVMIGVLIAAVLIFCRKRATVPKEPPVETEYANDTEANGVCEEVREEDRRRASPPAEVFPVYASVKHTKPNRDDGTDEDSRAAAAASHRTIEDASNKRIYSNVDCADGPAASLTSAPCGDADTTVYSVLQVEERSYGRHAEDTSPPVYSSVSFHQP
ncbi:uncharacterized protein LOC130200056 [Pseudoliparis swirei]|uniref:uncharacterized protein LOC130200056 n=1 Tax=Pseudoliparis swirei TaxID=2059687 RepID=UPI0024BE71C8|nr:uncharacterized protein LOC130200056 [Pseudoliparis swirei]